MKTCGNGFLDGLGMQCRVRRILAHEIVPTIFSALEIAAHPTRPSWTDAQYDGEYEHEGDDQLTPLFMALSVSVPQNDPFETFRLPAQLTPP